MHVSLVQKNLTSSGNTLYTYTQGELYVTTQNFQWRSKNQTYPNHQ